MPGYLFLPDDHYSIALFWAVVYPYFLKIFIVLIRYGPVDHVLINRQLG